MSRGDRRDRIPTAVEAELLVLDNASDDGSAEAAREWLARVDPFAGAQRLIALARRTGKAANDSDAARRGAGEYCLLLNEDSELRPGAAAALLAALDERPRAAVAGAQLLDRAGEPQPCAWRLPGLATALASALFLHRLLVAEGDARARPPRSAGSSRRRCSCAARRPSEVGCARSRVLRLLRRDRLREAAARRRLVRRPRPGGARPSTTSSSPPTSTASGGGSSSSTAAATATCASTTRPRSRRSPALLSAWTYLPRALAALAMPGHDPRRYLLHARAALNGGAGEGLREAAEA